MKYFNVKRTWGVETIDDIDINDFKTRRAHLEEIRNRLECYRSIGENVYLSTRCTKEWRNR